MEPTIYAEAAASANRTLSLLTPGMVWITLGISIVLPLLLGLYESNLPSPSLNLEHIIGSIVWKVRFMHRRSRGRSEASIAKRSAERAAAQQQPLGPSLGVRPRGRPGSHPFYTLGIY